MSKKQKKPMNGLYITNPETLYDPVSYGYSHVAEVKGDTRLIFIAGQGGEDAEGNIQPEFRAQVRQAFENVKKALQSVGLEMSDIAKLTTLIVDYDAAKHQILIEESASVWQEKVYPVQTLIPVPKLALEEMLFEVEVVAVQATK